MRIATSEGMDDNDNRSTTDAELPATQWSDDRDKCDECGKVKDRVLVRLNVSGRQKLCDECHGERSKR